MLTETRWLNKRGKPKSPTLCWSLLQPSLKSAPCDVLLLLDCCFAGSAVRGDVEGTNEIIAACGRETLAEGVTDRSFTHNLMRKIRSFNGQPFTVVQLYERLLKDRKRLITTPQYAPLSARERPSIVLAPLRLELNADGPDPSTQVSSASVSDETESLASTSQSLMLSSEVSSEVSFESSTSIQSSPPEGPRVLLALSLGADAGIPDVESWAHWLSTDIPYEIQGIEIRIEAAYRSHSTSILVSLPVNVWIHLRGTSAYRFIDLVTSTNLLTHGPKDWEQYSEADRTEAATVTDTSSVTATSSITDPSSISTFEESYASVSQNLEPAILKHPNQPTPAIFRSLTQSSAQAKILRSFQTGDPSLYMYEDCPVKAGDIRVLTVRQGVYGDTIVGTLTSRPLQTHSSSHVETLPYEALSYHWGAGEYSCKIKIHAPDGDPAEFRIKPNLYAALNHLRFPDRSRRLWIDAICINQDDDDEKNAQVSLMADVYSKAQSVCVWLGEASPDSNLALNFISRIVNLDDFDRLVADRRTPQEWAALVSLMTRPWFSRRWVIQEIALAARATLYCGDTYVDWSDFADAVSLFEAIGSESHISRSIMMSELFDHTPNFFSEIKFLGATHLVDATSNLFRKSMNGQVLERLLSLEALVSGLSTFQASRPHDVIYAVLNLAKGMRTSTATSNKDTLVETQSQVTTEPTIQTLHEQKLKMLAIRRFKQAVEENRFVIDYKKPFFDVCKEFLRYTIKSHGSLDIMCRPWVPEDGIAEADRPSWLLTTSKMAWGMRPDGTYSRANADTLVGPPGLAKRNYNASGSFKVTNSWKFEEGPNFRSMYVEGFVVDSIKQKKTFAADGIILNEWLSAVGWTDWSALPPDEFWRTLVADRGPNGVNPPTFYLRACKAALNQSVKGGHINTSTLIHNGKSTIVAKFLRRVQEVIWMKRLIITEHNFLGLAPEMSKKRDLICILYGCSVPVALRRMVDPVTNKEYFTFIGECYVHGIMNGESFELARSRSDNGLITNKVFELR